MGSGLRSANCEKPVPITEKTIVALMICVVTQEHSRRWLETDYRDAYQLKSKRSKTNFPSSQWNQFNFVDQKIEVLNGGRGMAVVIIG